MKIKLTPQLAYLAGIIKYSKIKNAVGVEGPQQLIEIFLKHILDNNIIEPQKIIIKKKKVYLKNIKLKTFLKKILDEEVERFKYHNDYAASFLAGLYDFVGEEEENYVILNKTDQKDRMVLINLGFFIEERGKKTLVGPKDLFIKFIKNYSKKLEKTK
ncbi:MAG: hypothetical protein QXH71_03745 [Candidatus Anstonellaceae archaeon]